MTVEEILQLPIEQLHKMTREERAELLAPLIPAARKVDEEARAEKERKTLQTELHRLLALAGQKKK